MSVQECQFSVVIFLFPLEDMTFSPVWRRQKDMIMKVVLLDILAPPPLNFTFTGSSKSKEGSLPGCIVFNMAFKFGQYDIKRKLYTADWV